MDEGDSGTTASDSGLGVDEAGTAGLEMREGVLDGDDGIGDVVQTFTTLGQEATHRGFRRKRLEELDERSPYRDHRLLDTLALDDFPIDRLDPISLPIAVDGHIEVFNGDGDMVEVEQLHDLERIGAANACHPGAGSICKS